MNQHQFFTGEIFDAYHWFGAHIEQNAVVFRTFAPNASRITLTGACNGWTETDLVQDGRSGFWSVSVPDACAGQFYKYRIYGPDGSVTEHCDPYGFHHRPRGVPLHRRSVDEQPHGFAGCTA